MAVHPPEQRPEYHRIHQLVGKSLLPSFVDRIPSEEEGVVASPVVWFPMRMSPISN